MHTPLPYRVILPLVRRVCVTILFFCVASAISTQALYADSITIIDGDGLTNVGPNRFDDAFIQAQLNAGNYTIDTANADGGGPDDIRIEAGVVITWNSQYSLTLIADQHIVVSGTIQHDGPADGRGGVVLSADDDGSGGVGDVFIGLGDQLTGVSVGSRFGLTRVAGRNVRLQGGDANGSYRFAQVGFYAIGKGAAYTVTGPISVTAALTIAASGGMGDVNYVQIGHGGTLVFSYTVDGNFAGNIALAAGENIAFRGGSKDYTYAQVGNGGIDAFGNHSGNHSLYAGGSIKFTGGNDIATYALAGNGGRNADGNHSGSHILSAGGDISFTAGPDWNSFAQVGNGSFNATGNHSGNHTLSAGGNIIFTGGGSNDSVGSYVQVGNGGVTAHGNQSGDHSLYAGGNIEFTSGNGFDYAQVGNGGNQTRGNHSGNHTLSAGGSIEFSGGSGFLSYAQVGNGGFHTGGIHSGNLVLDAGSDIDFSSGSGGYAYAQIGHGSASRVITSTLTGTRSGDITVLTGTDLILNGALVGHRSINSLDSILDGDTSIAVSQNDPFSSGAGQILAANTANFTVTFSSAFSPTGELRFYVPEADNVTIPPGTPMNAEIFPGSVPPARKAGFFLFRDGPYIPNADYAFYFANAALTFTKTVGIQGISPFCTDDDDIQVPVSTTVVYCFTITNTGNVTLTNHSLQDSHLVNIPLNPALSVAPGDSFSTTVTRTLFVTVTNVATWTASYGPVEQVQAAALSAQNFTQATVHISGPTTDQDGDRIPDNVEQEDDPDGDNVPNFLDDNSDGDNASDEEEAGPNPAQPLDSNGDGLPDFLDPDTPTGIDSGEQPAAPTSLFLPMLRQK